MPARRSRDLRALAVAGLLLLLLAWNNVVITRVPGYPASYAAVNGLAAVALLVAARAGGLSWSDLGLARGRVRAAAAWGGAAAALVAAGYLLALALPATRPLLADERVGGRGAGELAYDVLVRIPVGTVLWEEVAFRGVLLAVLLRLTTPRAAISVSALVFGLWHVRPTASALAANDLADGVVVTGLALAAAVVLTAGAHVVFVWLRLRSGSLLAPVLLHLSTNVLGTFAAAAATRQVG